MYNTTLILSVLDINADCPINPMHVKVYRTRVTASHKAWTYAANRAKCILQKRYGCYEQYPSHE